MKIKKYIKDIIIIVLFIYSLILSINIYNKDTVNYTYKDVIEYLDSDNLIMAENILKRVQIDESSQKRINIAVKHAANRINDYYHSNIIYYEDAINRLNLLIDLSHNDNNALSIRDQIYNRQKGIELIQEGIELYHIGEYQRAIDKLTEAKPYSDWTYLSQYIYNIKMLLEEENN